VLPGINNIAGLWPAVWTLGNLGRAGYGASLEGLWPYSYDSCDVGTLPNQTLNGQPLAATNSGPQDEPYLGALSYLTGQRLSRCTCANENHPGPVHEDGTYVGRSAPEIDIFEAQMQDEEGELKGAVSQSAQWAPFNKEYVWDNSSTNLNIVDPTISTFNTYVGGPLQQASSVITKTDQDCYQLASGCFSVYGYEYKPGFDAGYISWISNNAVAWTIQSAGLGPDSDVEIGPRPVPQEPMYIIMNLGMSEQFGKVDVEHLTFPAIMSVDWVRVYQPSNAINIGCDPDDFPTAQYIEKYKEAYSNPNLTTWVDDYHQPIPKNKLVDNC
jgi:beta-glucanase (GH16 family)